MIYFGICRFLTHCLPPTLYIILHVFTCLYICTIPYRCLCFFSFSFPFLQYYYCSTSSSNSCTNSHILVAIITTTSNNSNYYNQNYIAYKNGFQLSPLPPPWGPTINLRAHNTIKIYFSYTFCFFLFFFGERIKVFDTIWEVKITLWLNCSQVTYTKATFVTAHRRYCSILSKKRLWPTDIQCIFGMYSGVHTCAPSVRSRGCIIVVLLHLHPKCVCISNVKPETNGQPAANPSYCIKRKRERWIWFCSFPVYLCCPLLFSNPFQTSSLLHFASLKW